jgi:hypothetical protein
MIMTDSEIECRVADIEEKLFRGTTDRQDVADLLNVVDVLWDRIDVLEERVAELEDEDEDEDEDGGEEVGRLAVRWQRVEDGNERKQ